MTLLGKQKEGRYFSVLAEDSDLGGRRVGRRGGLSGVLLRSTWVREGCGEGRGGILSSDEVSRRM